MSDFVPAPEIAAAGHALGRVKENMKRSMKGKDDVIVQAQGLADSPEVAEQLRVSAEGLKAIAALAGDDDKADPPAKAMAALSKSVEVKAKDATVSLDWQAPLELIRQLTQTQTPASDKPVAK